MAGADPASTYTMASDSLYCAAPRSILRRVPETQAYAHQHGLRRLLNEIQSTIEPTARRGTTNSAPSEDCNRTYGSLVALAPPPLLLARFGVDRRSGKAAAIGLRSKG